MYSNSVTEPPISADLNQTQMSTPYTSTFLKWVFANAVHDCEQILIKAIWFFSRPSLFSSSHHHQQKFDTIVNPELPPPNVFQWPVAPNPTFSGQPHGYAPMNMPENGVPWKCPDWMVNQSLSPGEYMNFNGQEHSRFPFKRKASPEMETYVSTFHSNFWSK